MAPSKIRRLSLSELLLLGLPSLALIAAGFWIASKWRFIEAEIDRIAGRDALQAMLERVSKLDEGARAIAVPLAYPELLYTFRLHVEMVRAKIRARLHSAA